MTRLDRLIREVTAWWRRLHPPMVHPARELERKLPDYAAAVRSERRALQTGSTVAIHRAREAKTNALHRDMARGRQIGAR